MKKYVLSLLTIGSVVLTGLASKQEEAYLENVLGKIILNSDLALKQIISSVTCRGNEEVWTATPQILSEQYYWECYKPRGSKLRCYMIIINEDGTKKWNSLPDDLSKRLFSIMVALHNEQQASKK